MIKFLKRIILLGVLGACLGVVLGFFGWVHPALDTFSHFRMHASVGLGLAFLFLIFTRHKIIATLAVVIGITGAYSSQSAYPWQSNVQTALAGKPVYTLLHLNLLWNHPSPQSVVDVFLELDPDVLSLAESSQDWVQELSRLDQSWPQFYNCPENGPRGGVRIYAKWPIKEAQGYCGVYGTFGTVPVTAPSGETVTLGSVHLRWPWPASGPRQLETFIPTLRALPEDVLIAGDFNATPWSHTATRFAQSGGLEIIGGIGPTWLFEEFPASVAETFGIPIDHILRKGKVRVLEARRLQHLGSDHFPILVRFQIAD